MALDGSGKKSAKLLDDGEEYYKSVNRYLRQHGKSIKFDTTNTSQRNAKTISNTDSALVQVEPQVEQADVLTNFIEQFEKQKKKLSSIKKINDQKLKDKQNIEVDEMVRYLYSYQIIEDDEMFI